MSKPPPSTPHSDISGVHQYERKNVDSANDAGQDSGDLERANEQDVARPEYNNDQPAGEDGKA